MKTKLTALLTLMFCMSVLLTPVTAKADEPDGTEGNSEPDAAGMELIDKEAELISPWAEGGNPFTPSGTATVIDNAGDDDGKEFFTITAGDGNDFYLVIDRQRSSENVYLLRAVTEHDLSDLALEGDGRKRETSGNTQKQEQEQAVQVSEEQNGDMPAPAKQDGSDNTSMYVIVGIAAVAAGGLGYYFKIVKGRQQGGEPDYEDDDGYDDDEEARSEAGGGEYDE